MKITLLLLLTIAATVSGYSQFYFKTYGNYCGYGHGDLNGTKPQDQLDRVCQIHDICVSGLGMISCHCSMQFHETVLLASNSTDANLMDLAIITGSMFCWSKYVTKNIYAIGSIKERGFNFLPMYSQNGTYNLYSSVNVSAIIVSDSEYDLIDKNNLCNLPSEPIDAHELYHVTIQEGHTIVIINCQHVASVIYYGKKEMLYADYQYMITL